MYKKFIKTFSVLILLLILFNVNGVNGATSGDYNYDIKSDGTIIITSYTGNDTKLSIPSYIDGKKVTELGEKSFSGITSETVTIPITVTTLNNNVFYNADIKSVTIPSSVTKMGTYTFVYCFGLEKAVIDANIEILPEYTFFNCYSLKNVTLSTNIKELGNACFFNCSKLADLSFLNSIEKIGQQCFDYCTSLTTVKIPKSVIKIERKAFCDTVELDLSNTRLVEVNPGVYVVATEITTEGTYNYNDAYEILRLLNEQRVANGLTELKMDKDLLEAAMLRCAELSVFYNHTRPTGLSCFSASEKMYGENIAYGNASPDSASETVMNAWMNSEGHRKNILTANYTTVGVGCFYKNGVYYWAQCFGKNELTKDAAKPSNSTGQKRIYVSDEYVSLDVSKQSISIKPGEKTTITITNNGEKCDSNCATWTSSNKEFATVDSNGTITGLKNGTTNITVTLGNNQKIITVYVQKFNDITKGKWYVSAIDYCYNNKIILGTSDTKFEPNKNITRSMLVTILYRMEGSPKVTGTNKFSDVISGKYYYNAVIWAESKGIVNGYKGTRKFGPNDNIKRQDLAGMLSNYAKYKGKYVKSNYELSSFSDSSKVSNYALPAMRWAVKNNIVNGSNGKLNPKGTATRAEAASMIYNYCNRMQ